MHSHVIVKWNPYEDFEPYGPRTTLHVANVERVCKASERDHKNLTPDYYRRLPLRVRYWFKISDIRRLQPDPRHYLLAYDPVSVALFPRLVKEKEDYHFFDYSITRGRRWYVIQSLDAMLRMPGELEELTDV